jgi:hypothetical protein
MKFETIQQRIEEKAKKDAEAEFEVAAKQYVKILSPLFSSSAGDEEWEDSKKILGDLFSLYGSAGVQMCYVTPKSLIRRRKEEAC